MHEVGCICSILHAYFILYTYGTYMPYVRICHLHVRICTYAYGKATYMVQPCTYGMSYLYHMRMNRKYACKYVPSSTICCVHIMKKIVHYLTEQNGPDGNIYRYVRHRSDATSHSRVFCEYVSHNDTLIEYSRAHVEGKLHS